MSAEACAWTERLLPDPIFDRFRRSFGLQTRRILSKNVPAHRMVMRSNLGQFLRESGWRPHYSLIAELICNQ